MCCGTGRPRNSGHYRTGPLRNPVAPAMHSNRPVFEYVGRTGLTVTGPVSGARYRFDRPGERVAVDARDRAALSNIPVLRPVL